MSYYSPGEKVTYMPTSDGATILRALPNDEYVIEFDSATLIPPQMTVPGNRLSPKPVTLFGGYNMNEYAPLRDKRFIDKEKFCPVCDLTWTKTEGFRQDYYDCRKCGLKKEKA